MLVGAEARWFAAATRAENRRSPPPDPGRQRLHDPAGGSDSLTPPKPRPLTPHHSGLIGSAVLQPSPPRVARVDGPVRSCKLPGGAQNNPHTRSESARSVGEGDVTRIPRPRLVVHLFARLNNQQVGQATSRERGPYENVTPRSK